VYQIVRIAYVEMTVVGGGVETPATTVMNACPFPLVLRVYNMRRAILFSQFALAARWGNFVELIVPAGIDQQQSWT